MSDKGSNAQGIDKSSEASINTLSERKKKKEKNKEESKALWEEVGFHRPLGGLLYNYLLLLVVILPGMLVVSVVLPNFILPYPEAIGFYNITLAYLNVIFFFADFGIKNACSRYIAEHSETNPRYALKYVSFFFWFQMITGLIQITVISLFTVMIIPYTDLAYAVWFFLIYLMIQWPGSIGMATGGGGIFEVALGGFQQFDKQNILFILREILFTVLTSMIFILLGRMWGLQNPQIGELMGSAIGFIFGMWIDNIVALLVGMHFFNKVLEPFGIKVKESFYIIFDKKIVKEVLLFGGKVMPSGLAFYLVSFLVTMMYTLWLWNYSTLLGLYYIAATFAGAVSTTLISIGPPLAESYNNGKKELSLYYIRIAFVWWGILIIAMFSVPITVIFPSILSQIGGEFAEAAWMIFPLFIPQLISGPMIWFPASICESCDLPEYSTFMNLIEQSTKFAYLFFVLNPWFGIATFIGREYVVIFWLLGEAPGYIFKGIFGWIVIKKKLFPEHKLKIPLFQAIIIPVLSFSLTIPIALLFSNLFGALFAVNQILGFAIGGIFIVSMLYIIPIFVIFPFIGFLGIWDDKSLDDFRKAAIMSGPSRAIVNLLYKATHFGYKHSPFKDRFTIPHEKAMVQAQELTQKREIIEVSNA